MGKSLTNTVTFILAAIGLVIASWLTIEHFIPQAALPCGTVGDCHGTLASNYGHFGPIPTAAFGACMYALLALLCFKRHDLLGRLRTEERARAEAYATSAADETVSAPNLTAAPVATIAGGLRAAVANMDRAIWVIALAGVCISWWLQYTALFVLVSFCPWCFSSACIISGIFLVSSWDFLIDGRVLTGEQKMLGGVLAFIGVMMLFMVAPDIARQYAMIIKPQAGPVKISGQGSDQAMRANLVIPDLHTKGNANAKYTLVEFADYMCPACHDAVKLADDAVAANPDIRLAFRNFPLPSHAWSRYAADAAEAAGKQGKFWPMHDYLYAHQKVMEEPGFSPTKFEDFAQDVGLDMTKFRRDFQDTAIITRVETDVQSGNQLGVTMTPSFFVVSPSSVWRFAGAKELTKALADRTHPMWK